MAAFSDRLQKRIFPLIESRYGREDLLTKEGWYSFLVPFEVQREYCDEEELAQERVVSIEAYKEFSFVQEYRSEKLRAIRDDAKHRAEESGLPEDAVAGPFARKVKILVDRTHRRFMGPYIESLEPFYKKMKLLRASEIDRHNLRIYKDYNPEKKSHLVKLGKAVIEQLGAELGFTFDKKLSKTQPPTAIYSKPSGEQHWRFIISFWDSESCSERYQRPSKAKDLYWWSQVPPELWLRFGIWRRTSTEDKGRCHTFDMAAFFPINAGPFMFFYRQFWTFAELEALIIFNFNMYNLIRSEFDDGLKQACIGTV